jgi:photosystem II stability/assembly factor-like uncharacterized protein
MKFKITGICIALLLLLTGSALAQWQLQYQIQQNYTFNAVHFPSASVGYIVGSGGVIFKTSDGGSTWTQQTSPTTSALNDVFFTDNVTGWAVGAAGTVIYTTDGTNWTLRTPAITTAALYGVSFVGLNGVIGGGADNAKCTIYYTTDGGTTWTAVLAANNPSLDQCTDISMSDATHVFASCDAGNTVKPVMFSTDGGVTWTLSTTVNYGAYPYTRYDLEAIRAISNTTIIVTGWGSYVGGQPTVILVSTDGGVNFNAPDPTYAWATYGYGYNVAAFDDGEAVIVGGASQAAGFTIHGTGTGYPTWTRSPAFYAEAIEDACALPGTNKIVAVGDAGLIALSTDRGAHWTFAYDGGMPFQGIQRFVALGNDHALAAGAGGAILHFNISAGTHDYWMASPNNWGPTSIGDMDYVVNPDSPGPGIMRDSTFNDVIYLSGATKYLCKSYNGGKSWTELSHTNALQDGILGMYWFHPDTGIVVGHKLQGSSSRDEVIWKTVDGGVTLTEVLMGTIPGTVAREWKAVDFAPTNRNIGVVVGTHNKMRYTTDGGVTWPLAAENIADTSVVLWSVALIDPTTGFAVGDKGTLVKTTDGGANWTVQAVPWGTKNLVKIIFDTPNRLWVSGVDQLVYYSTDGGANWTNADVTAIPAADDVLGIFYQGNAGILWAGTHYSKVFNRTDAALTDTDAPKLPFALNQNYPNPFNPSTTITFAIEKNGHVGLNVYDVSGRLVAKVMDETLKAGTHTITFNADKLATGVYFYKLSTSSGEITRKMVIIR